MCASFPLLIIHQPVRSLECYDKKRPLCSLQRMHLWFPTSREKISPTMTWSRHNFNDNHVACRLSMRNKNRPGGIDEHDDITKTYYFLAVIKTLESWGWIWLAIPRSFTSMINFGQTRSISIQNGRTIPLNEVVKIESKKPWKIIERTKIRFNRIFLSYDTSRATREPKNAIKELGTRRRITRARIRTTVYRTYALSSRAATQYCYVLHHTLKGRGGALHRATWWPGD